MYKPLKSALKPLSHEPDPDHLAKKGDQLKMKLFENRLFNSRLDPDPNEVKQGAVGTCPLAAVLVATAHVKSTKKLIIKMISEVKLNPGFLFITIRTREPMEYAKDPSEYRRNDPSSTMDHDYRTWDYEKDEEGNFVPDEHGNWKRKTKKEFLVFIEEGGDYKSRIIDVSGEKVVKYERNTKNKKRNLNSGPVHFFDTDGNLNDEVLPLLPHDQDPVKNFVNKTRTVAPGTGCDKKSKQPGFCNKRWFTVRFRNKKEVAVTSVLHTLADEVYYMSSTAGNLWPAIAEKAYVIVYGEYLKSFVGGTPINQIVRGNFELQRTYQNLWRDISLEQAMEDIVGPNRTYHINHDPELIAQGYRPTLVSNHVLREKLKSHNKKPTCVASLQDTTTKVTIPGIAEKKDLTSDHAFAVVGYNQAKNQLSLRDALYPATITISFKALRKDFSILVQSI